MNHGSANVNGALDWCVFFWHLCFCNLSLEVTLRFNQEKSHTANWVKHSRVTCLLLWSFTTETWYIVQWMEVLWNCTLLKVFDIGNGFKDHWVHPRIVSIFVFCLNERAKWFVSIYVCLRWKVEVDIASMVILILVTLFQNDYTLI